jgi:hypothetical protein
VSRLCRFTSGKEKRYPLNRRLGADLDASEKFAPDGVRPPDRPALSESLHRLRYPGRQFNPFSSSTKQILKFLADDVNKFQFLGAFAEL